MPPTCCDRTKLADSTQRSSSWTWPPVRSATVSMCWHLLSLRRAFPNERRADTEESILAAHRPMASADPLFRAAHRDRPLPGMPPAPPTGRLALGLAVLPDRERTRKDSSTSRKGRLSCVYNSAFFLLTSTGVPPPATAGRNSITFGCSCAVCARGHVIVLQRSCWQQWWVREAEAGEEVAGVSGPLARGSRRLQSRAGQAWP